MTGFSSKIFIFQNFSLSFGGEVFSFESQNQSALPGNVYFFDKIFDNT